jgi:hypothetical protein
MNKNFNLSLACLLILLTPFIIASFYNVPYGDDFWYANMVKDHGKIGAVTEWYNTLSGRYITNLLMSYADPLVYRNFDGLVFMPLFCIISLWLVLHSLISTALSIEKKDSILLSGTITASYFLLMPDIREGLFWMSGMMNYHTGVILFLLLVRALIIFFKKLPTDIIPGNFILLYSVFSFLLMGINECIAFGWIGLLFLINAYQIILKKKYNSFLLSLFGAAFLGALLIIFCPGNQHKAAEYADENRNLFTAILNSILGIGYYILKMFKSPFAWGAMLLSIVAATKYSDNIKSQLSFMAGVKTWLVFAFIFLLMMYFPAVYFGKDHKPPLRVSDTLVIFFILVYLISLKYLPEKYINWANDKRALLIRTGSVLCVAGLYFSNFSLLTRELVSKEIQSYNTEVTNRLKIIESCVSDTCIVPYFRYHPLTLAPADTDPENDLAHLDKYYGRKAIMIAP